MSNAIIENNSHLYLPPEILLMVFSHLTPDQLRRLVTPVCEYWQKLSYDPTLWKKIQHDGRKRLLDHTRMIFKNSFLLQTLEFSNVNSWNLLESLPKWGSLRSIRFDACKINAVEMSTLVNNSPMVEKLYLENYSWDEEIVNEIARWQFLKNVSMRTTDGDYFDGSVGLELIAENCKFLESVEFGSKISVDEESFLYLTELRAAIVKSLFFEVNYETLGGIQNLQRYTGLTKLLFTINHTVPDFNMLVLKKLILLEDLTIHGFTSSEGYGDIFKETTFRHLTTLKFFWGPNLDNFCLENIAKSCPKLKKFVLVGSKKITESGLATFSKHCRNLETLILHELGITCESLAANPLYLPKLVFMAIADCSKVTDEILSEIVMHRPNLVINCPSIGLRVGKNARGRTSFAPYSSF